MADPLPIESRRLSTLLELADTLGAPSALDDLLQTILVGVTAHQGLGYNRAFLALLDESGATLDGVCAVGPSDPEEAARIWNALEAAPASLRELLSRYRAAATAVGSHPDARVNEIVHRLHIPMDAEDDICARAIREGRAYLVSDAPPIVSGAPYVRVPTADARSLAELLGCREFAVVPLSSGPRVEGVLIVDQSITGTPIGRADIDILQGVANLAATAIGRARLEQELRRQLAELEAAHRAVDQKHQHEVRTERLIAMGEMATQLAHEIRNPLTTIGGFARSLMRRYGPDDPDLPFLTVIAEEVARLEAFVTEVLSFGAPKPPVFHACDAGAILVQVAALVEDECARHHLRLDMQTPSLLPAIRADADQLRQVLLNLARNAIQATPEGGAISLRAEAAPFGETVQLLVHDTGQGIPRAELDKIFQAFYSTKSSGTGLGLAIAHHIVGNHGGTIEVESVVGSGTTFTVTIPVATVPSSVPVEG